MNQDEFEKIGRLQMARPILKGADLADQQGRTLMYGYNVARQTFHVYLRAGVIHQVTYRDEVVLVHKTENEITSNDFYVPEKRAYPGWCDLEFCAALILRGVEIPFTTFDPSDVRLNGACSGKIFEELVPVSDGKEV